MHRKRVLAGLIFASLAVTGGCRKKPSVIVGSKNFPEQMLLGEIIAQHLEHRLGQKVTRQLDLGGTLLAQQALLNGQVDLYPEYTGTGLIVVLKDPIDHDPSVVLNRVRREYELNFKMEWMPPLGFSDPSIVVVRGEDARKYKLETLSDAAKLDRYWRLATDFDFSQRDDGYPALAGGYSFSWAASFKTMDEDQLYTALEKNQVNMIAVRANDGMLTGLDVKLLQDDKGVFPPEQAAIVVRQDSLAAFPGLREALESLSGKFTDEMMQKMNHEVEVEHRPVSEMAAEFLKQAGL